MGGGAVAWGPAWAQAGEADTFPPFPVSLRSDAPHPTSGSLWASARSYHLLERASTALSPQDSPSTHHIPLWLDSPPITGAAPRLPSTRLVGKLGSRPPSAQEHPGMHPQWEAPAPAAPVPVHERRLLSLSSCPERRATASPSGVGPLGRGAGVRTSPSDALWLASPHGRGASCKKKGRAWARFVSLSGTWAFLWGVPPPLGLSTRGKQGPFLLCRRSNAWAGSCCVPGRV